MPCGPHQEALVSLGLLSAALESFWEGQLSQHSPLPGGRAAFVYTLTQPPLQKHPLRPEPLANLSVPSVPATTPEGQRLDRARHQPSAPHSPAVLKKKNEITDAEC